MLPDKLYSLLNSNIIVGHIKERTWYGPNGMEHIRTVKEPKQAIPTFVQTIELLMKVSIHRSAHRALTLYLLFQPENQHVKFNVDVKVQNDPARLFSLMHKIISAQPDWETKLAPRLLLGLWHPKFLEPAKSKLPYCRRSHIGTSPATARKYFWKDCDAFSMDFASLTTSDGQKFRAECKAANKQLLVWTVNEPNHMMEVCDK